MMLIVTRKKNWIWGVSVAYAWSKECVFSLLVQLPHRMRNCLDLIDVSPWLGIWQITLDNLINIYRCDCGPVETLLIKANNEYKATIASSFLGFSTLPGGKCKYSYLHQYATMLLMISERWGVSRAIWQYARVHLI